MTLIADKSLNDAAVFVRGLPPDTAKAMLGRLSAEEADVLRAAIARLDEETHTEPDSERDAVSDDGNVELHLSASPPSETDHQAYANAFDGAEWLRSLRDADPSEIAAYLSREQPRAIAAVLERLPPELGAGVVQCLPSEDQAAVVARLAAQHEADPDSLRVIASGLQEWLQTHLEEKRRFATRVATIRQILVASPPEARANLLRGLAENESRIAEELADLAPPSKTSASDVEATLPDAAPTPIGFDVLVRFDGRTLADALGTLDPRSALLALAGAPESLIEKLSSGLPATVAKDLRRRIHGIGPTTLTEIDRSQAAFASAVATIVAQRRAARSQQLRGA